MNLYAKHGMPDSRHTLFLLVRNNGGRTDAAKPGNSDQASFREYPQGVPGVD